MLGRGWDHLAPRSGEIGIGRLPVAPAPTLESRIRLCDSRGVGARRRRRLVDRHTHWADKVQCVSAVCESVCGEAPSPLLRLPRGRGQPPPPPAGGYAQ